MIMDRLVYYIKNSKAPTGTYEVRLYELCRRKKAEIGEKIPTCDCIAKIHALMKLKKRIFEISEEGKAKLDARIQENLDNDQNIIAEYNIVKSSIKFCSDYIARFGLFKIDDYNYRTSGRTMNLKPLDMMKINKCLINTETV